MRISEITINDLINYCRIDDAGEIEQAELTSMLGFAKSYICNYTGLEECELDEYEDLVIACFMLVADFFDNRNFYIDYKTTVSNKAVDTILNMHCRNFV